jgi:prevent-host-death family protein
MTEISVAEAKTRLTGLIHQVESGEVAHLTCHGRSVSVLMSESDYAAMDYMNGLYDRLGLPEEMNERISQEIAQLIECSLQ